MTTTVAASTPPDHDVYDVPTFCARHRMSRVTLYKLWRRGKGPRRMEVGSRIFISVRAAQEWRDSLEAEAATKAKAPADL